MPFVHPQTHQFFPHLQAPGGVAFNALNIIAVFSYRQFIFNMQEITKHFVSFFFISIIAAAAAQDGASFVQSGHNGISPGKDLVNYLLMQIILAQNVHIAGEILVGIITCPHPFNWYFKDIGGETSFFHHRLLLLIGQVRPFSFFPLFYN